MLWEVLTAAVLITITLLVHGGCTAAVLRTLPVLHAAHWAMVSLVRRVVAIALLVLLMICVSLLEAWIWAAAYRAVGAIEGAEPAMYFSVVTFTTLGYGDITVEPGWRVLASLQAATGIVVFGWTTALVIAAVQRIVTLSGRGSG